MVTRLLLLLMAMMMKVVVMKLSLQDGVWTLSPPRRLHMDSINMRHVLRWRPPQDNCSTAVLYSVQFQGEFELTVLNSSWVDALSCQLTPEPCCDLTFDLGSDSDYSLRVSAVCGSERSAWTRSSSAFNRRETLVTAPLLKVLSEGGGLQVSVSKAPPNAVVTVTAWKRGEELQVAEFTLLPEQRLLHIPALQAGGEYCVRAQTLLGPRSSSSTTQCVSLTHTASGIWKTLATVAVTAVATVTLVATVFWCISRCSPADWRSYFRKEALPPSLQPGWDVMVMSSSEEAEPMESVSVVLVVLRTDELLLEGGGAASAFTN